MSTELAEDKKETKKIDSVDSDYDDSGLEIQIITICMTASTGTSVWAAEPA